PCGQRQHYMGYGPGVAPRCGRTDRCHRRCGRGTEKIRRYRRNNCGRPWHDRQTSRHGAGVGAKLGGHSAGGSIKEEEVVAAPNERGTGTTLYRRAAFWAPPATEKYARVKPWVLKSADQFRPGPPPQLFSERYGRDFNETKNMGGIRSTARTPDFFSR